MKTIEDYIQDQLASGKSPDYIIKNLEGIVHKEDAKREDEKRKSEIINKKRTKAAAAMIEYLYALGEIKEYKPSDIDKLVKALEVAEKAEYNWKTDFDKMLDLLIW